MIRRRVARPFAWCAILSLVLPPFAPPVGAQGNAVAPVISALRRYDLPEALREARASALAQPNNAVAMQVLGLMLVANGDVAAAEQAFGQAAIAGGSLPPTETGLEALDYPRSTLREALNRQKVSLALGAGGAAARNNLGAVLIVLGSPRAALAELQTALNIAPDWGLPHANRAVALLEMNENRQAEDAARAAQRRRVQSAKVFTSLAEAALREDRVEQAADSIERAIRLDPRYPYGLFVQAQIERRQDRPRRSERALFQALALHPGVAAEARYFPRTEADTAGGSDDEDHEHVRTGNNPGRFTYRGALERDRREVDGRENADQARDFAEAIFGRRLASGDTSLYAGFLSMDGGRPGQQGHPDGHSDYDFNRTNLSLLHRHPLWRGSDLLLRVGYRHHGVFDRLHGDAVPGDLSVGPSAPATNGTRQHLRDDQWSFEGRWDVADTPVGGFTTGLSYTRNRRDLRFVEDLMTPVHVPSIEPNEQLLPEGTTDLWVAYAFGNRQIGRKTHVTGGPVLGKRGGGSSFVMPYVDARRDVGGNQQVRASARPLVLNAAGDLYPLEAQPEPAAENRLDRRRYDSNRYNQKPYIQGPDGRVQSYELGWSHYGGNGAALNATVFHRRFSDILTFAQDPRLSPGLFAVPIGQAEASGAEVEYYRPLGNQFTLSVFARYQETHDQTHDDRLPYFPRWETESRLDWSNPQGWRAGLQVQHVGSRLHRFCDEPMTRSLNPSLRVNLLVGKRLSHRADVFLDLFNLLGTDANYYAGFPADGPSALGGFRFRF